MINTIVTDLHARLVAASDPAVLEKEVRLTSGAYCLGVLVPQIREIAKGVKKEYALTFPHACALMDAVCVQKCREEILSCIFIMASFPKKLQDFSWSHIDKWLPYIDNWETCDQLSGNLAAELIHRDVNAFDRLFVYAESPSLWIRRFALATAANANHGGFSYPRQTRALCEKLKKEKEPMVKKALVWASHALHA